MEGGIQDRGFRTMKKEFSTQWIASKQPRKQRKYRFNAPLHIKHKFLSTHLSKELRKKYAKRNLPLRVGDEVLIMRGTFKKKKAKVSKVDLKNQRVSLENIQRSKKDGSKISVYLNPRVLQIVTLNLEDKERTNILNKNSKTIVKENKNASN